MRKEMVWLGLGILAVTSAFVTDHLGVWDKEPATEVKTLRIKKSLPRKTAYKKRLEKVLASVEAEQLIGEMVTVADPAGDYTLTLGDTEYDYLLRFDMGTQGEVVFWADGTVTVHGAAPGWKSEAWNLLAAVFPDWKGEICDNLEYLVVNEMRQTGRFTDSEIQQVENCFDARGKFRCVPDETLQLDNGVK